MSVGRAVSCRNTVLKDGCVFILLQQGVHYGYFAYKILTDEGVVTTMLFSEEHTLFSHITKIEKR